MIVFASAIQWATTVPVSGTSAAVAAGSSEGLRPGDAITRSIRTTGQQISTASLLDTSSSNTHSFNTRGESDTFSINFPGDKAVLDSPDVIIRGDAPANSQVRRSRSILWDERIAVDADGQWEYEVTLEEGTNSFEFYTDASPGDVISIKVIYEPPQLLNVTYPVTGESVSTESIVIQGTAPPAAEIRRERFLRSDSFSADQNGHWEFPVSLEHGRNDYTFSLNDFRDSSIDIEIEYDSWSLSVHDPPDDALVYDSKLLITGMATPGEKLRLSSWLRDTRINVDDDGSWEHVVELDQGENDFEFYLQYENDRKLIYTVLYYEPELAIEEPSTNDVMTSGRLTIQGTSAPHAALMFGDNESAQFFATGDGEWSHTILLEKGRNKLQVSLVERPDFSEVLYVTYRPETAAVPTPEPMPTPSLPVMSWQEQQYLDWLLETGLETANVLEIVGVLMIQGSLDPRKLDDPDWISQMLAALYLMDQYYEEAQLIDPPAGFQEIHDKWDYMVWELSMAVPEIIYGIDNLDPDSVDSAGERIKRFTSETDALGDLTEAKLEEYR